MAKQTINLGTGELTGDGESIRSAFDKINSNFDELYTQDSNDVVLSAINGHIIPDTDVTYDLGSASNRFRDLYLSGSTIDLGGTTLSVVGGNLQIGGTDIKDVVTAAGVDYSEIQNTPDLSNYVTQAQLAAGSITVDVNNTGDLTGSVFADDSTLLVDGIAGKIVGAIDTAQQAIFKDSIVLQNGNDIVTLGDTYGASFQLPNKAFSILGGGVDGGSYNIGFTANGNGSLLVTEQFNILSGAGMTLGTSTGLTIQGTVDVNSSVTAPSFVGDVTGSVLLDDSTVVIDGTSGNITGNVVTVNDALNAMGALSVVGGTNFYGDINIWDNSKIISSGDAYFGEGISVPSISSSLVNSNNLNINAAQNVIITADTDGLTPRVWNFNTNGSTTFPGDVTVSGTLSPDAFSDPNVVNKAGASAKLGVGINTATMDFLTVRIAVNTPGELDVEFNYDAGGTVAVSANGDVANRFSGTTNFTAGNTTWTAMNTLTTIGDKGEMTIVDHSGHKIYRVTTFAGEMPGVNPGDAYCVIERLK